jgi:hypothetical protein
MRNQSSNLVVAPRAGFEPATNRLMAALPHAALSFQLTNCERDSSPACML